MKKSYILLLMVITTALFSISTLAISSDKFTKVASGEPQLTQQGEEKMWCPVCGMSIKMFYKTSHASQHQNGEDRQYCSIRCLALDMEEFDINLDTVKVIDAKTEKMIDANKAYYVMGSKVMGTMSKVSKLAFENQEDADAFAKKMGGKVVDFNTALAAAKESLKSDIAMSTKKKEKKMYPMGKKIFAKMCDQAINPTNYIEINQLKADIKTRKLCGDLNNPKQFQAVALYLWEVKRYDDHARIADVITVDKDEKCPVCGMFVYKYPRWAAQIFYKHEGHDHHFSFDGVKDLMKLYFNPGKWGKHKAVKEEITKIIVTDYYSQKAINGKSAFYVTGSDILGPMGNELIPFAFEDDAKTFARDHKGSAIIGFDQITEEKIYQLDE